MGADPRFKYRYHDIHLEDISQFDRNQIKSNAISNFVNGAETSQVPLVIDAFMAYLTSRGYRITKEEENGSDD